MKINYIWFLILLIFLFSCSNKKLNDEIAVINDAFLTVTDTIAYYELSLRPAASDPDEMMSETKPLQNKFAIVVADTLYSFTDDIWTSTIRIYCRGWGDNEEPDLIELKKRMCKVIEEGTAPQKFKLNHLKNTGKYVVLKNKENLQPDVPFVGKIQFSQIVINEEKSFAVFAAKIYGTGKSGIEKLFFLSKQEGKWKVIRIEILSIY